MTKAQKACVCSILLNQCILVVQVNYCILMTGTDAKKTVKLLTKQGAKHKKLISLELISLISQGNAVNHDQKSV
jgi:hypothetical protein